MRAGELRRELELRGLELLGVTEFHANPEVLTVYLHGNAGQTADGFARSLVAGVPGVRRVSESLGTPTILLALVEVEAQKEAQE